MRDGRVEAKRRRPSATKLLIMIAVLAVAAGVTVAVTRTSAFRSAPPQTTAAPPAISVVAASVKSHDVPIYLRGVGTVIPFNNVIVRSQITGQLVNISFDQGQTVKTGDVLAVIDPRPYQAQLDQAIANRDRDQALSIVKITNPPLRSRSSNGVKRMRN